MEDKKIPWRKTKRGRAKSLITNTAYRLSRKGRRKTMEYNAKRAEESKAQRIALVAAQIERFGVPYRVCEHPNCLAKHKSRGLCNKHYIEENREQRIRQDPSFRLPRDPNKANQNVPRKPELLAKEIKQK